MQQGFQVEGVGLGVVIRRHTTPTPYYYGVRAELFLHDAEKALLQGDTTKHAQLMLRAMQYQVLAEQLPLEKGLHDHTEIQEG